MSDSSTSQKAIQGLFTKYIQALKDVDTVRTCGKVVRVKGMLVESEGPMARLGDSCEIFLEDGSAVLGEVVGFNEKYVQIMTMDPIEGVLMGNRVVSYQKPMEIFTNTDLIGKVLNVKGKSIAATSIKHTGEKRCIYREPLTYHRRCTIKDALSVGVRAIDGLLTIGKGQRIGLFSGSGVGKSTLLSMIARNTTADVNVIALCGERGREVNEFIEHALGEEGMQRSVLVVATSDEPSLAKVRCVHTATTIAEYFRDLGKDVLLMVDSITRLALAQREIGASLGEPPTTRGYTPSVFTLLPKLIERAGMCHRGSITAFYTVLVEGDDMEEPIADAMRGILDGHIVLSRKKANKSHYPAIDVVQSISRLSIEVCSDEHYQAIRQVRRWLSAYEDIEDLIPVGAYTRGNQPLADEAIRRMDFIDAFLQQSIQEKVTFEKTIAQLMEIAGLNVQARRQDNALSFQ